MVESPHGGPHLFPFVAVLLGAFFALCTRMRTLFATVPAAPPSIHATLLAQINEFSDMVDSISGLLPPPPLAADDAMVVAAPPVPRSDPSPLPILPCLDLPPAADNTIVAAASPDPCPDPDTLPPDQGGVSLPKKKRRSRRK